MGIQNRNGNALTKEEKQRKARPFVFRFIKVKMILAIVLIVGALAAAGLIKLISLPPSVGTPLANSVRVGNNIVTLIESLEGYIPSMHRNPMNDRYSVALFVAPVDDPTNGRMIPICKGLESGDLRLAHVIGFDGINLWCDLGQLKGVNLKTGEIVDAVKLREANPSLDEYWDDLRRITCYKRLRVTTPDWKRFFEIDPETLKAAPVRVEPGVVERGLGNPLSGPKLASFLKPLEKAGYLHAAIVRSGPDAEPLRLSDPDGFLMIYTAGPERGATLMVARVTAEGKVIWKADTGIDRISLKQILPDKSFPAFVGTRPPVPDKVSEPLVVIINTQSGEISPRSLWR